MDLLKEAIAEAKAVREIAEKNAISTLTEAFSPQMQSLLSRKIAEEEEMEDEELDIPIAEEGAEEEEMKTPAPPVAAAPEEVPTEEPMEDEDDLDIDEVLRELEGEDDMEDEPVMEEEEMADEPEVDDETIDEILREVEDELAMEDEPKDAEMATENKQLHRKLKEAHKVIATQKNILNEVGVLNAKLLYTTKILGKHDLTEAQKLKILEAFDRAKSLRETKLVYATIIESLKKTSSKPSRRVVEGSSSKSIKSAAKPTINEASFINKDRWKLLAGI